MPTSTVSLIRPLFADLASFFAAAPADGGGIFFILLFLKWMIGLLIGTVLIFGFIKLITK